YGLTATKQLNDTLTLALEAGQMRFREYRYDDGQSMRFGTETRANAALVRRLYLQPQARLRLDGNVELNFLRLTRDVENGTKATATGGDILYGVLGLRLYKDALSLALAVKRPIWTRLNEEDQQQGAEGKERLRTLLTLSTLF
ncbi:MAG: hypothetical protein N2235_26315, partial [Fischerella sp.]|nr:hypothetical protein [Fischerella sp.]